MAKPPKSVGLQFDKDGKHITKLNPWMENVIKMFSKGLTLEENVLCDVKTIRYVSTSLPIKVSVESFNTPPAAVMVLRAQRETYDGSFSTSNIVTWKFLPPGEVVISDISGLTAGAFYQVKLAILAG